MTLWMPGVNVYPTKARGGYGIAAGAMRPDACVMHTKEGWTNTMRAMSREDPVVTRASYHFGLAQDGEIDQYVPIRTPAWHAGRLDAAPPTWELYRPGVSPNAHTISISAEGRARLDQGPPNVPLAWTEAQIQSAIEILRWAGGELGIDWTEHSLTEHSQIAVLTRTDPGARWPKARVLEALGEEEEEEPMPDYYFVKPGDNLSRIANLLGMAQHAILALNRQITQPHLIEVGQALRLNSRVEQPPLIPIKGVGNTDKARAHVVAAERELQLAKAEL